MTALIYVGAALLTLLLIWMDAWDGWVARRRNEASKAGAVFDILGAPLVGPRHCVPDPVRLASDPRRQ